MKYSKSIVIYLVALNLLVFILTYLLKLDFSSSMALFFPENPQFAPWQLLSHLFLHASIMHIAFNMYGLWNFGQPLVNIWGNLRFGIYFIATGVGAGLIYTLANYYQFSAIEQELFGTGVQSQEVQNILQTGKASGELLQLVSKERLQEFLSIFYSPAVGASGAIYGILIAFALYYPHAKLMLIFLPIPIKAMYFIPFILLGDLFFGLTRYSVGNVAHFAHIGGAMTGALIILTIKLKNRSKYTQP